MRKLAFTLRDAPVLALHLSDTHLHLLVAVSPDEAGRLCQRVGVVLSGAAESTRRWPARPAVSRIPVETRAHLRNAFEYVLRNDERHGVAPDPWRENSSLPDLLGARVIFPGHRATVQRFLPRLARLQLLALAEWPDSSKAEVSEPRLLAAAAAAALGLPILSGQTAGVVMARAAAVQAGVGLSTRSLAVALAVSDDTVLRLRRRRLDPNLPAAVRWQAHLQTLLAPGDVLVTRPDWSSRVRMLS